MGLFFVGKAPDVLAKQEAIRLAVAEAEQFARFQAVSHRLAGRTLVSNSPRLRAKAVHQYGSYVHLDDMRYTRTHMCAFNPQAVERETLIEKIKAKDLEHSEAKPDAFTHVCAKWPHSASSLNCVRKRDYTAQPHPHRTLTRTKG